MSVRDRDYMRRTVEEERAAEQLAAEIDREAEIPLWEWTADALRVRLHDMAKNCPMQSIQELAALIDAARTLQVFHVHGQQLDRADPQTED